MIKLKLILKEVFNDVCESQKHSGQKECTNEVFQKGGLHYYPSIKSRAFNKGKIEKALYYFDAESSGFIVKPFEDFINTNEYLMWKDKNKERINDLLFSFYNSQILSLLKDKSKSILPAKLQPNQNYKSDTQTITNKTRTIDALKVLGIDPSFLYTSKRHAGSFLKRSDQYYWEILEMAKKEFDKKIRIYHPDLTQDPTKKKEHEKISRLLTASWMLVKQRFSRLGYIIGGDKKNYNIKGKEI